MNASKDGVTLCGLDGANPLGFLTALGVVRVLQEFGKIDCLLSWRETPEGWRPSIYFKNKEIDEDSGVWITDCLIESLGLPRKAPDIDLLKQVDSAEKNYRDKIKQRNTRENELKAEGKSKKLTGKKLSEYVKKQLLEIEAAIQKSRSNWLTLLRTTAFSPELGLGKTLSVTPSEFRDIASEAVQQSGIKQRVVTDLLAAFGTDGNVNKGMIEYTPFCFVTGSGHQYFLDTVSQLLALLSPAHIQRALFHPWKREDDRLSLRWDPVDDRRYALMWNDPTSAGNETKTMWGANLFAYYGLSLFPSMPSGRKLETTGFRESNSEFSWPLWGVPCRVNTIRSLLSLPDLRRTPLDHARLGAMGIYSVYRSERFQVGTPPLVKINFSSATPA